MHNPHRHIGLEAQQARSRLNRRQYMALKLPPGVQLVEDEELNHLAQQHQDKNSKLKDFLLALTPKIFFILIISCIIIQFGACGNYLYTVYVKYGTNFIAEGGFPAYIQRSVGSVSANLKADPMIDLQVMDKNSTCPDGFELLKLRTWPGTVTGCLCDNGDLYASSCRDVGDEKCKKKIPHSDPIQMYEWDSSIFCVKRAVLGTDYIKKAECPAGYKECYPGGCFVGDCPITKLEISADSQKRPIASQRKQGEFPLINIQMTPNDIPCFNKIFYARSKNGSSYKLSKSREDGCDESGLDSYFTTQIDSHSAFESYTQNSFPYSVMDLPHFEKNAKSSISILSQTARMKTAKNDYCLDLDENTIKKFTRPITALSMLFKVMHFGGFIKYAFSGLLLALLRSPIDKKKFKATAANGAICCLIVTVFVVIQYIIQHPGFMTMEETFERYYTLGCFGEGQGDMMVQEYLKNARVFEDLRQSFWAIVWCWVVEGLIGIYYCCSRLRRT